MKKLILLTIALCLMASSAFAWPIKRVVQNGLTVYVQSYNNSYGQSVRTVAQWFVGPYKQATGDNYTRNEDGTCTKTFYLIQYFYDGSVKITYGVPQTVVCP